MPFLVKNRVSEWKCCIFFSSAVFFFRLLNLSEWVDFKLFLGKKNTQNFWEKNGKKKYTSKIRKVPKNSIKYLFLVIFFADIRFFLSEWLANFSQEKINNSLYFFFPKSGKKNKILPNRVSEWRVNYSREIKKYGTFDRSKNTLTIFHLSITKKMRKLFQPSIYQDNF